MESPQADKYFKTGWRRIILWYDGCCFSSFDLPSDSHFAELMRAAQEGDSVAYGQLLEEISPRIRRIVRRQRWFLQAEDIEDLVQDVLL